MAGQRQQHGRGRIRGNGATGAAHRGSQRTGNKGRYHARGKLRNGEDAITTIAPGHRHAQALAAKPSPAIDAWPTA